ncbi:MAG: MmcQ/YjbR family DNA-binding protein [Pseudomonadota bacterium]
MTVDEFRALALSLPRAIEKPHFDRASFRVDAPRGKTIATLLEADATANVFLTVEEQEMLVSAEPSVFSKVPNKWGDKGATTIALASADEITALSALKMSWRHAAPAKLQDLLE